MKLPVQSHQQSVRVQCHLKPLQLRHTGCSRLWKVGVSEAQFWITMDKSKFLGLYWTDVSIYEQLHMWASKWLRCPPQYMNISWNVFSAMKMIFHHNLSKEPKFALLRTIPAGSEGSAQTLATYQETRPISTILYKTPNFCLARGMQNTVIIQRSGPRQWQSQQYRQIWSKCWGEILIRSPSC